MATGSRVCPHCGALNAADEKRCHRCGRGFPGPLADSLGGAVHAVLGESWPVTRLFMMICLVVYVLMTFVVGAPRNPTAVFRRLWSVPLSQEIRWGILYYSPWLHGGLGRLEPWRFVSAMFVHFGILHIVFNASALMYFGRAVEERVGSARTAVAFFITGVLGFVASDFLYATGALTRTAGASGAIFGLIGVLVGYLYAARDPEYKRQLAYALMMALIIGIAFSVNNAAHVGGLVAGLPLGYLFHKERRPERLRWLMNALAVLAVVASVGSLVLCQRSPYWRVVAEAEDVQGLSE